MKKIEAVIFDRAGTTVDYGCFAPVQAFIEAFSHYGITPSTEEVRAPMGMLKIGHIRTMLSIQSRMEKSIFIICCVISLFWGIQTALNSEDTLDNAGRSCYKYQYHDRFIKDITAG